MPSQSIPQMFIERSSKSRQNREGFCRPLVRRSRSGVKRRGGTPKMRRTDLSTFKRRTIALLLRSLVYRTRFLAEAVGAG